MAQTIAHTNDPLGVVLGATTDAVAVHREGKIVYANAASLRLLGYSRAEEVIGRPVLDFVAPRDRAVAERRIFEGYGNGRSQPEIEEHFVDAVGNEVPVEVLAVPVVFEGAKSTLVHIRDLRIRKALEDRLRACERLAHIGFVASAVVHEIRSPLGAALTCMDLISQRRDALTPEVAAVWDRMCESLNTLRDVVRDVGIFSGTALDLPTAVDVHAILDSMASLVGFELRNRARLVKRYGEISRAAATNAKLGHVFANLLVNAAQAIPPGSAEDNEVAVVTYAHDGFVFVEIQDTGVGIPADKVHEIFEPFFTTKAEGMGFGLPIARSLVEELGGTITVHAREPRGTVFVVKLRAAP